MGKKPSLSTSRTKMTRTPLLYSLCWREFNLITSPLICPLTFIILFQFSLFRLQLNFISLVLYCPSILFPTPIYPSPVNVAWLLEYLYWYWCVIVLFLVGIVLCSEIEISFYVLVGLVECVYWWDDERRWVTMLSVDDENCRSFDVGLWKKFKSGQRGGSWGEWRCARQCCDIHCFIEKRGKSGKSVGEAEVRPWHICGSCSCQNGNQPPSLSPFAYTLTNFLHFLSLSIARFYCFYCFYCFRLELDFMCCKS